MYLTPQIAQMGFLPYHVTTDYPITSAHDIRKLLSLVLNGFFTCIFQKKNIQVESFFKFVQFIAILAYIEQSIYGFKELGVIENSQTISEYWILEWLTEELC